MAGETVGLAAAFGEGVAFGLAVGAGVGVATGAMMVFGGGLAAPSFDPDLSAPFGSEVFDAAFRAVGDGLLTGLAGVLAELDAGFVRAASRLLIFDPTGGTRAVPGALKTTSSLFERCSTCAVAPGCSRNEITVLSAPRWTLTSANPRPRVASARGTSAAGSFT
jgi:hypothetical protein